MKLTPLIILTLLLMLLGYCLWQLTWIVPWAWATYQIVHYKLPIS